MLKRHSISDLLRPTAPKNKVDVKTAKGRDGPRDKTSGHELLFSVSFFVLGWYELRFLLNSLHCRSRSLFSGREECLQYARQTCEACEA